MTAPKITRSEAIVECPCGACHRLTNVHRGEWAHVDCAGCGRRVEAFFPVPLVRVTARDDVGEPYVSARRGVAS